MLSQFLSLLRGGDPSEIVPYLLGIFLALVFGITVHEFAHAFVAYRLGDPTPLRQGRVTLNPAAHLEPFGMLMFVLAGFGWGRPVMFNPAFLRANPRTAAALVSLAGPTANLILGVSFGLLLRFFPPLWFDLRPEPMPDALLFTLATLTYFVLFNFILAVFNLIPLPPLDGSKILPALLPPDMAYSLERLYIQIGPYSLLILFALLWLGGGIFDQILFAPVYALFGLVTGL